VRHSLPADVRALGRTPLFRGCTDRQLCNAQRYGTIIDADAGRVLCRQGERPGQLVVIVSGRVISVAPSGAHRILGRGECFGALATPGQPFAEPEGVAAVTASVLFVVGRNNFAGLVEACPSVAARLSRDHSFMPPRVAQEQWRRFSRRYATSRDADAAQERDARAKLGPSDDGVERSTFLKVVAATRELELLHGTQVEPP
jgi:CRP-like cAMP-binding protein